MGYGKIKKGKMGQGEPDESNKKPPFAKSPGRKTIMPVKPKKRG